MDSVLTRTNSTRELSVVRKVGESVFATTRIRPVQIETLGIVRTVVELRITTFVEV